MGRAGASASARSRRATPRTRCAAPTSRRSSGRRRTSPAARTTGTRSSARAVRGVDGAELGTVQDIYRVGETEVFVVGGGPVGSFDLPGRPRLHPDLRAAPRARSWSTPSRSTCDPRAIAARPRTARRRRDGAAGGRRDGATGADRAPTARRRGADATPTRAPAMTLEIDILTLFPAMVEAPLGPEHPWPDPGAGPRDDPDPRPARRGGSGGTGRSTTRRTAGERG